MIMRLTTKRFDLAAAHLSFSAVLRASVSNARAKSIAYSIDDYAPRRVRHRAVACLRTVTRRWMQSVLFVAAFFLISSSTLLAWVGGVGVDVGQLNLPTGSQLALSNTSMIVENDSFSKIYNYVVSGYDNGKWDGSGVISSVARDNHSQPYMLGIMTGADYKRVNGPSYYGYSVQDQWILVDFTLFGDSNFDHVVNQTDYNFALSSFNLLHDGDPSNNPPINWLNGDYNYDGVIDHTDCKQIPVLGDVNRDGTVNSTDLGLLLSKYNQTIASGDLWSQGDLNADGTVNSTDLGLLLSHYNQTGNATSAVPEPSTVALIAIASTGLLGCALRRLRT
jgi:hypothetical protein